MLINFLLWWSTNFRVEFIRILAKFLAKFLKNLQTLIWISSYQLAIYFFVYFVLYFILFFLKMKEKISDEKEEIAHLNSKIEKVDRLLDDKTTVSEKFLLILYIFIILCFKALKSWKRSQVFNSHLNLLFEIICKKLSIQFFIFIVY